MPLKKNQSTEVDINTLNLLPVAVAIFDNKKVYFVNIKAAQLFQISKQQIKNINSVSIFQFLDKQHHNRIKQNNSKILKGEEFPSVELSFKTFKNKPIFIEAKSNCVTFENKKLIQTTFIEITELKGKQVELEKSNELLNKISKNSSEVIFEFSFIEPLGVKFISESANKVLGFSAQQILKKPTILYNATHPDDKSFFIFTKADYIRILKTTKTKIAVVKYYHPTKKLIFLETEVNPIYDTNKKLVGLIGSIRDVSSRFETEALLLETKYKFDLITKSSNDIFAFYTYFPEEKYIYVSPNVTKILGYQPEDFLKDNNFFNKRVIGNKKDFLNIDKIVKNDQKKNSSKKYHYTYKTIKKNKEEIWLENNLTPIKDASGKVAFFINIIRDITIQKEKEIELQQEHLNYRNLLDSSPVAYIIHKQGVTVFCNKAMLKLLKIKSEKQILGRFVLDFLAEGDRMRAMERIKDIYDNVNPDKWGNYLVLDSKGNLIEAEMKSIVIKFNNSPCILTLINNITERRKFEREKIKAEMIKVNNEFLLLEIKERQEAEKKLLEKTAHLSSIFESSDHLIWTVNKNFEITSFNKNFANLTEINYKYKLKPKKSTAKTITNNNIKLIQDWHSVYQEAFKGKKLEFEREGSEGGETIFRKVYINPIINSNGDVEEISCIAHDITEAKVYEKKLVNQSAKLMAIFESGSHLIWTINKNLEITSYNQNYYELIKDNLKNNKISNPPFKLKETIKDKTLFDFWIKKYDEVFSGGQQVFVHKSKNNTSDIYHEIFLQPIYADDQIIEISAIAQNITERINNENKILEQSAKINAIFDSSNHYIWTINTDQKLTSFNKNYYDLISSIYNTQPYIGFSLDRGVLGNDKEYTELLAYNYKKAFSGNSTSFEIEILDKSHSKIYLEVFLSPVYNNQVIEEVSGIAHNVTEKKQSHQRVEQSLKEKDVLLKEVHHRVKNNMQIISSILNLQSSYVTDNYTLALLKESQNRIKTMAYIHESLYQNKSFTSVNFSEYVETLSKNIIQSYALSSEKIELILNLEKITLNLDVSIPAGLIINELITNAIKHAFPNSRKGIICLNLRSENNIIFLEVADNGIGIPDEVELNNTNTLGLQLVNTLIDQLDAEIIFKSEKDKGTEVLIKFKM